VRRAGSIAASVLRAASSTIRPGITTLELDRTVGSLIEDQGAISAFLGYRNFPSNCCISVNEGVVHGIGSERRLQYGDLVKLDVGVRYRGFVGDVAMTVAVGGCSPAAQKLMDVTVGSLYLGIGKARAGNKVSDVSRAIQNHVEANGFSVVREFVGHGVGRSVHEEPQIPNYVDERYNCRLVPGLTIAIEPMVNAGTKEVKILADHWTVATRDKLPSVHFEHTVAMTERGPQVLTDGT